MQLPRTITPALSGLPAPSPAFTGRDEQVATLLGDLAPTADRRSDDRWLEPAGARSVAVSAVAGLPSDGVTAALMTSRHTPDGLDARLHDLGPLDEVASVTLLDRALRHSCSFRPSPVGFPPSDKGVRFNAAVRRSAPRLTGSADDTAALE